MRASAGVSRGLAWASQSALTRTSKDRTGMVNCATVFDEVLERSL